MIPIPIVRFCFRRTAWRAWRLLVVAIALVVVVANKRGTPTVTTVTSAFVVTTTTTTRRRRRRTRTVAPGGFGTKTRTNPGAAFHRDSSVDASTSTSTSTSTSASVTSDTEQDGIVVVGGALDPNLTIKQLHTVRGVRCREVVNELPVIGRVVVLEATADAQEELVDECLELEDEKKSERSNEPARIAEGDPYGAVLWPAAWAVSNYLLSEPDLRDNLSSLSILELGTGTGLVSIAAAMGGARRVIATDYEPLALDLTRYAADKINSNDKINDDNDNDNDNDNDKNHNNNHNHNNNPTISTRIETRLLDMCALETQPLLLGNGDDNDDEDRVDVVVAADIMYEPKTGIAMAHRAIEALRQNCRVIIGDSPGRPGRPAFLKTLRELGVDESIDFAETIGKTCSGPRHDLICGKGSTSVSETPEELFVALLDLKPEMLQQQLHTISSSSSSSSKEDFTLEPAQPKPNNKE